MPSLLNCRFVPHYARVVSIANHFGNAYYHFVIESLIRLEPLLPEVHTHTHSHTYHHHLMIEKENGILPHCTHCMIRTRSARGRNSAM
jgi:hypothetical protein